MTKARELENACLPCKVTQNEGLWTPFVALLLNIGMRSFLVDIMFHTPLILFTRVNSHRMKWWDGVFMLSTAATACNITCQIMQLHSQQYLYSRLWTSLRSTSCAHTKLSFATKNVFYIDQWNLGKNLIHQSSRQVDDCSKSFRCRSGFFGRWSPFWALNWRPCTILHLLQSQVRAVCTVKIFLLQTCLNNRQPTVPQNHGCMVFIVASHSQEWSISNFPCSLTRNITSHIMKNLAFHSLLRYSDERLYYQFPLHHLNTTLH